MFLVVGWKISAATDLSLGKAIEKHQLMRGFIPKILAGVLNGSIFVGLAFANADPPSGNHQKAETEGNRQAEFGWHFAGIGAVESAENAPTLQDVWRLPESRRLGRLLTERLARTPERQLFGRQAVVNAERVPIVQSLAALLLVFESFGEVKGLAGGRPHLSLAVKLAPPKAAEWEEHLRRYFGALDWRELADSADESLRWTAAKGDSDLSARLARQGEWLLFGAGSGDFSLLAKWKASIAGDVLPSSLAAGELLLIRGHADRLAEWLAGVSLPSFSDFEVRFKPEENGVRTMATIRLREAIEFPLPDWDVPAKFIRDPMVSFSGARGLHSVIAKLPAAKTLAERGIPEQFFSWSRRFVPSSSSMPIYPFPTYLAWPIPLEEVSVERLNQHLSVFIGPKVLASGRARLISLPSLNKTILQLREPLVEPFVRGFTNRTHGVRIAGLFPLINQPRPVPDALLAQLDSAENLVYYHWEITQNRIEFSKNLFQLLAFLAGQPQMKADGAGFRWLDAIAPKMGNAVTIVTAPVPQTLELVRKSYFGFTGLELAAVARWLESESCPWIDAEFLSAWKTKPAANPPKSPSADAQTGR